MIDTLTCTSATFKGLTREQKENCAFSLTVPNEFYIIWDNKITFQKQLGSDVSMLTEMVNDSIKSQLHIKALSVECLQRKSMRYIAISYSHATSYSYS